jgi:hypothetical protein
MPRLLATALRLLATALCFTAAGADSPPNDGPELHQPELDEKAPPVTVPRATAGSKGMDFASVAAIVALILAMVVPLFFLMRTQKQGDEQEVCLCYHRRLPLAPVRSHSHALSQPSPEPS